MKWLIVSVVFGLLFLGCTQQAVGGQQGAVAGQAVQEFSVVEKQFEFIPSTVTVKKGVPVRIKVTTPDVKHSFAIPELKVNVPVNPNETAVVEFTPDKAGTFPIVCWVPCGEGHKEMKGTLVVIE